MNDHLAQLDLALNRYEAALIHLEEAKGKPCSEAVIHALIARDVLQVELNTIRQISPEKMIAVIELDSRLKKQAGCITQVVQLTDWCASFNRTKEAWWWFLEDPTHRLDSYDWLWNTLTVTSLTASLSLVVDISSRFLSSGLDFLGSFAVISQSALALLTAGGVLTEAGRTGIERVMLRLGIQKYLWQEVKLGLSGLLLLSLMGFRGCLPEISFYFNERGFDNYREGDWSSAISDYERALSLNPDNAEAHYNLGRLYDDLEELDKAQTHYRLAMNENLPAAYVYLARLYLRQEKPKPAQAASLLNKKQDIIFDKKDNELTYEFKKNLGWARFQQKRYNEARSRLEEAIAINPERGSGYCLLAQVMENLPSHPKEVSTLWESCIAYGNPIFAEEDMWYDLAQKQVNKGQQ